MGLEILLFALASIVMLALYAYATMKSGNSKAGFVVAGLLCSLAFASFSLRPQMLGYLFLILVLIILEKFRQGKNNTLWFLPPIFLLWVNTHGSFIIGIGVVAFYLVAGLWEFHVGSIEGRKWTPQQRVRLELALLLSLAVLPLTPYGVQIAVYPFDMAFSQPVNVANVQEWQPMPFNIGGGKLFLLVVVAFFVAQMLMQVTLAVGDAALFFGGIRDGLFAQALFVVICSVFHAGRGGANCSVAPALRPEEGPLLSQRSNHGGSGVCDGLVFPEDQRP